MSRYLSRTLTLSAGIALSFALSPAHAELSFTLDHPNQIGVAGQTLTFGGTLTENSAGSMIDATSYDITNQVGSTFTTANITDVFGPAHQGSLSNFGSTHETFFTLTIPTTALSGDSATGDYYISYSPTTAVAQAIFFVSVAPAAVPEPGSVALLVGMGAVGAGFLRRRKQARLVA